MVLTYQQFLRFFKMATKFLLVALFFALAVIKPVHDNFPDPDDSKDHKNKTKPTSGFYDGSAQLVWDLESRSTTNGTFLSVLRETYFETGFLTMYLVFTCEYACCIDPP